MIQNTFGKKPQSVADDATRAAQLLATAQQLEQAPAVLVVHRLRWLSLRNAVVSVLIAVNLSPAWAALVTLVRSASDAAHLPPRRPALVLISATPNGPNTSPITHHADGLEVAA